MTTLAGITGLIGSGKTHVSHLLQQHGHPVYDTDSAARHLMEHDSRLIAAIRQLLGPQAYTADQHLDRTAVARRIFHDDHLRGQLNALVHPAVRADLRQWARRQQSPIAFVESALLFEAHLDRDVDTIIVVTADEHTRIERAMRRDNTTEAAVRARMAAQPDQDTLRARADHEIRNDHGADLEAQLRQLINQITHNQQTHTPCSTPSLP